MSSSPDWVAEDNIDRDFLIQCGRGWSQSKKVGVAVIIAVSVGLVVLLAGIASLAYWYFAKYRHRDQVKYNNLNQVEIVEQETLIGDQQL